MGVRAPLGLLAVLGPVFWVRLTWAGPGVIVESRVEAFAAPSREARVAAQFGRGAQICVLDQGNYAGALMHRPGWLAVRVPEGVGYIPIEAIDLSAPAPDVRDCGVSEAVSTGPAPTQTPGADRELPPRPPAARMAVLPPESPATTGHPIPSLPERMRGGFVRPHPARLQLGLGLGQASYNKDAAAKNKFDDSSLTLNMTLGLLIWDIFSISGAFSAGFPEDFASFSQQVVEEPGGGDPFSADSSLSVYSYSMAAALRTPFWALSSTEYGWVSVAAFAEYGTAGVGGSRSISNCSDCRSDTLELSGGDFWRLGADLLVPRLKASYGVTVSYQRFTATAAFHDEVRVGFSCWLF